MDNHEFQLQVIDTLGRLETKMDALVGQDGNGGSQAEIRSRVDDLEREKWRRAGAVGILGAFLGGICQFLGHYVFSGGRQP